MANVPVNSIKASEISNEMVALYLLASIAENENNTTVIFVGGIPKISGKSKEWLLTNYVDCLRSINSRNVFQS